MPITKQCEVCGKEFRVKPSHFDKRFCCSKQCQVIRQKDSVGELNNNYRGGPRPRTCQNCGVEFDCGYYKRKYCSKECAIESSKGRLNEKNIAALKKAQEARRLQGINNPKKKCVCGETKEIRAKTCLKCHKEIKVALRISKCNYCGKMFIKKYTSTKYCSPECNSNDRKIKYALSGNPNWGGGIKIPNQRGRYSVDYYKWIKDVFVRDNYTCTVCGIVGGTLHAHHIKPWAEYVDSRYNVDNGQTLCITCHKYIHATDFIRELVPDYYTSQSWIQG